MRKIQLVLFFLGISIQLGFSQELTNEQNRKYFVQGISVTHKITLNDPISDVENVLFYSLDSTNQIIYHFLDTDSSDGFSWTLDMGTLLRPLQNFNNSKIPFLELIF